MALVQPVPSSAAKIKVVGIGGAGGNAVDYMIAKGGVNGVEFISINTDAQALLTSKADVKLQIGEKVTRGLGAGGDPRVGKAAAEESKEKIKNTLSNTDMIFIAGGMGGGTCSGAAAVVAQIAKEELGALTVAVLTKPFLFEGTKRMVTAEEAVEKVREKVDTLIIVPNQRLLDVAGKKMTLLEAFGLANSVLGEGVKGISELITATGLINLDFADVKAVMKDAGSALLGVGEATGEKRAEDAVKTAISSPLLDVSVEGARGVLFNVTGGTDLTMADVEAAAKIISEKVGGDANIIFGAKIDENMEGVKVTVIATGFDETRRLVSQMLPDKKTLPVSGIVSEIEEKEEIPKKKKFSSKTKLLFQEKDLPEGVEILDDFDIPAYLRKGK